VIFNKDLFDETELRVVPLEALHQSHRRLSKFRQDPVSSSDIVHVPEERFFAFSSKTRSYRSTAHKTLAAQSIVLHHTIAAKSNTYLPACLSGMAYSLVGG
jgi:hypothetical protein